MTRSVGYIEAELERRARADDEAAREGEANEEIRRLEKESVSLRRLNLSPAAMTAALRGAAVSMEVRKNGSTGRGPKFTYSGLLKCELCDSSLVIVGGSGRYRTCGCSGHAYGRTCTNSATAKLIIVEDRLSNAIKMDLLSPELLADLETRVARRS